MKFFLQNNTYSAVSHGGYENIFRIERDIFRTVLYLKTAGLCFNGNISKAQLQNTSFSKLMLLSAMDFHLCLQV